jgi:HSP20 family protein
MWSELLAESTRLFDEFDWLSREMDRLFEPLGSPGLRSALGSGYPTVNVATDDHAVHVLVFAPGVAADKIDVQVQGRNLTIAGKRDVVADPAKDDQQIWVNERFAGEFRRSLMLPEDLDTAKVEAQNRDGVLWIRIARSEAAKPRKIQIH